MIIPRRKFNPPTNPNAFITANANQRQVSQQAIAPA